MTEAHVTHYEVTNVRSGVVKAYKTRDAATKAADKADAAYGAVCCTTRAVWSDQK